MKLTEYLESTGEAKAKFAARVGLSPGALADLLSGRRQPSPESAVDIERETGGAVRVEDWEKFEVLKHRDHLNGIA